MDTSNGRRCQTRPAPAQVKLIVSTPALRERQWAGQLATQQAILEALEVDQRDPQASFQARVTVAACLAAAGTAVLTWVENGRNPRAARPDRASLRHPHPPPVTAGSRVARNRPPGSLDADPGLETVLYGGGGT